jgi:hypothetical protein
MIMPVASPENEDKLLQLGLEHSWKWVEVRTNQALQVMNWYIVSCTILFAAYFAAINAGVPLASAALAVIGFACVGVFAAFHFLVRKVVGVGYVALMEMQRRLAVATECPELKMQELSGLSDPRILIKDLGIVGYIVAGTIWICAFAYAATLLI